MLKGVIISIIFKSNENLDNNYTKTTQKCTNKIYLFSIQNGETQVRIADICDPRIFKPVRCDSIIHLYKYR